MDICISGTLLWGGLSPSVGYILLYHSAFLGILNAEFCKYGPWKSPEKDYTDLENLEFDHKKLANTLLKAHFLSLTLIRPEIKSTFGIHDALGLRYFFQLRVNLSPSRSYARRHNFSDTPSETCECNLSSKDIRHFLFECPFYAIQRVTLAVNIIDMLQRENLNHLGNQPELYLYGHPSLDLIDNRQILLSTIKYVKATTRFSTSVT